MSTLGAQRPSSQLEKHMSTTRMHSSRMRTARSSSHPGGLHQAPPPEQAPLDQAPPHCKACWDSTPPAARHAGIPPVMHAGIAPPPVNRMTNGCKNITLPQTSFAGGKYAFQ